MSAINLDHNAAGAVDKDVLAEMLPFFTEKYGNTQSTVYEAGQIAYDAVEKARAEVASLLGAAPDEILFTSSGTESNNLALKGICADRAKRIGAKRIVISSIEHHSIAHAARRLKEDGYEVVALGVDSDGLVNPDDLRQALEAGQTSIVSIQHSNAEIGTIQNTAALSAVAREFDVPFHTDAVASVGQLPLDVNELGVQAMSVSSASISGPKGVGALFLRKGTRARPIMDGGVQERGLRPGTENVPGIVGMGRAASLAASRIEGRAAALRVMRDALIEGIRDRVGHARLTGHRTLRLPGHVSHCFDFIEGEGTLLYLAMKGIAASSGSTCSSKALKASHVLTSIGIPAEQAQGSIVMSLGDDNTQEQIDTTLDALEEVVGKLREMSPLYANWRKENQECTAQL